MNFMKLKIFSFSKDSKAAILVFTAFVVVSIFILIAIAVDFSRWQLAKRTLQNGIDAAVIAIAKQPDFVNLERENAELIARQYISYYLRDASIMTDLNKASLNVEVSITPDTGQVTINANIDLDNTLLLFNSTVSN